MMMIFSIRKSFLLRKTQVTTTMNTSKQFCTVHRVGTNRRACPRGVSHTDKSRTREWTTVPPFLLHPRTVTYLILFRRGARHWRVQGRVNSWPLHPFALVPVPQHCPPPHSAELTGEAGNKKQKHRHTLEKFLYMERRIYSLLGFLNETPDTQSLPLLH